MPRRRLDLPEQRLVTASIATQLVGAASKAKFLREVDLGFWPRPHPCSEIRGEGYWDVNAIQQKIDRGSGLMNTLTLEKDELRKGLTGEESAG